MDGTTPQANKSINHKRKVPTTTPIQFKQIERISPSWYSSEFSFFHYCLSSPCINPPLTPTSHKNRKARTIFKLDPSYMVQRKAPRRPGLESKASENRQTSHQPQDKRSNGRGGTGGDDPSKKMKKTSTPTRTTGGLPNYMKPTSTSDAKKDRLQVTIQPSDSYKTPKSRNNNFSKPSPSPDPKPSRSLTRKASLKPVRSSMKKSSKANMNKPTCSSTLKDSKFPKELDVSDGVSIVKVCPYTYCSLNGHTHEPLPPLKCFLSARRQLVKNQKSMKLKRLSSLIAISRMPSGLDLKCLSEDGANNFFLEVYDKPRTNMMQMDKVSPMEENWEFASHMNTSAWDENYKEDMDLTGDFTAEEMDLLKDYAGWDSDSYIANELDNNSKDLAEIQAISTSFESIHDEFDPILNPLLDVEGKSLHTSERVDVNGDENPVIEILDYGLYEDNMKEEAESYSNFSEVQFSDSPQGYPVTLDDTEEFDCMEIEMEAFTEQSDSIDIVGNNNNSGNGNEENLSSAEQNTILDTPNFTSDEDLAVAGGVPKARYKPVRATRMEDVQEIREFNPRPPRFLPLEHDPEAEKVRLRTQLMDERKNTEEWMIDYALQQVVTKLAPARKRKVELLVEAFETIMPLPVYKAPLHAISGFTHSRPMQACS